MFLFDPICWFILGFETENGLQAILLSTVHASHGKVFQFINILTNIYILVRYLIHPSINSYALKLFLSSRYWLDALKFCGNELTEWTWDNNRNS